MRRTTPHIFHFLCLVFCLPAISLAASDLKVSARSSPSPVVINGSSFIAADISNFGDEAAQDVILSSTLPLDLNLINVSTTVGNCAAGATISCNLGTLNSGNLNVLATVTLEVSASVAGSFNNSFTVSSSTADENALNDSASTTLEIVALSEAADLAVVFAYPGSANAVDGIWQTFSYQSLLTTFPLLLLNNGPAGVSAPTLDFSIPQLTLTDFNSATAEQGSCSTALNSCAGFSCLSALQRPLSVHCDLGALSAGGTVAVNIVVKLNREPDTILQTSATVKSTIADADAENNLSRSTVQILPEPACGEECSSAAGCFIATAAYGSAMQDEVQLFRNFRDQHLLPYRWGRQLVSAYYDYSPPLAKLIAGDDRLRALVRGLLTIPLLIISYPLTAFVSTLLLALLALRSVRLRVKNRRHSALS